MFRQQWGRSPKTKKGGMVQGLKKIGKRKSGNVASGTVPGFHLSSESLIGGTIWKDDEIEGSKGAEKGMNRGGKPGKFSAKKKDGSDGKTVVGIKISGPKSRGELRGTEEHERNKPAD